MDFHEFSWNGFIIDVVFFIFMGPDNSKSPPWPSCVCVLGFFFPAQSRLWLREYLLVLFFMYFFLWIFFMDFFLLNFGHRRVQRSPTRTAGREKALPHRTEWRCRFFFFKKHLFVNECLFLYHGNRKKRIHCINDRSDSERWSRSFCFSFRCSSLAFYSSCFSLLRLIFGCRDDDNLDFIRNQNW